MLKTRTELPKIILKGGKIEYYFDERISQIRNIENPNDFHNLSRDENAAIAYFVKEKEKRMPFKLKDLEEQEQEGLPET